jgi:hypothetical protein
VSATPDPSNELRLHPGWWARLEGEQLDLEALADALGDRSPVQIRQFDGRSHLRMAEFDRLDESADVETNGDGRQLVSLDGVEGRLTDAPGRLRFDPCRRPHPALRPTSQHTRRAGLAREAPTSALHNA